MSSYDATFKIVLLGDSASKTALIQRFLTNLFVTDQTMTIGIDFEVKSLIVDGKKVKLQIWDFDGGERFRFLLPTYVRGADGALFIYDIANYTSINNIDDWLSVIRKEVRAEIPISLVGITSDEKNKRQVSVEDGKEIAKSRNLNGFIECNLKTGKNVEKAFEALIRLILADNDYHSPQNKAEDLFVYCYKCNLQLTKEEFLKHPCFTTGAVSLRGDINRGFNYLTTKERRKKEKKKRAKKKRKIFRLESMEVTDTLPDMRYPRNFERAKGDFKFLEEKLNTFGDLVERMMSVILRIPDLVDQSLATVNQKLSTLESRINGTTNQKSTTITKEIYCQYCGRKLTKEEQFTHSCNRFFLG